MSRILLLSLLSLVFLTTSCNNKSAKQKTVLLTYQRTECFGNCPVYNLTVYTNGEAEYEAKRFLPEIGQFKGEFKKADIKSLIKNLEEIDFCEMDKIYGAGVSDLPASIITYNCNGQDKKVEAVMNYPESLALLIKKLDDLCQSEKWEPVNFD